MRVYTAFKKLPTHRIKKLVYKYLVSRDIGKAKKHLFGGSNINSVLKTRKETEDSLKKLRKLRLVPHPDRPKNWDAFRALSFILQHGNKNSRVLDVGSADYGVILPWLELYGFNSLYGCDIAFEEDFRRGAIRYSKQDLQNTNFPSGYFDFITSLSVIEHGVNLDSYFKEMGRILKKGGYLLTSTDYWPTKIDTKGLYPYGGKLGEMKIFTKNDIKSLIRIAEKFGFKLTRSMDFTYKDRVVNWELVGKRYTFVFFVFERV